MNAHIIGKKGSFKLKDRQISLLEYLIILLFSILPLFKSFPFRGTIYLSWEGAYRLYLGQIPYKDFGLPMGFGYWIIPAVFFKIFGPYLFTLIKAQVFINIVSAFAFRSILRSFKILPAVRLLAVWLFLVSYSYINYWPWYNHTVIVFELIAIAFLLKYILGDRKRFSIAHLFISAFFFFLSFFTKQDAGAFALIIGLALIICHSFYEKKVWPIVWFLSFYLLVTLCIVIPFIPYNIGYWFNYGQPPHYDRLSVYDIFDVFLSSSPWLRFYILIITLILIDKARTFKLFLSDVKAVLFTILMLGILLEASIIQVTSYIPKHGNIFFHSFAIVYIFAFSDLSKKINFRKPLIVGITGMLILVWWSSYPWDYTKAVLQKHFPRMTYVDTTKVSIENFAIDNDRGTKSNKWILGPWKQFNKIYMPEETINGIKNVLNLEIVKEKKSDIKFLNMSELTPIEDIMGYTPETGKEITLWYHKNVGIFKEQINSYEKKIKNNYYDLVLFEYFPSANNFYPFEIRETLKKHYQHVDSFPIPQKNVEGSIEVYVKKP